MSTVRYRTDPIWSDIIPIPQSDGPNPVCSIAYTNSFTECMDYFRAILATKEYSERVLKLTEDVIEHNSANYTAWYYRRQCLYSIKYPLLLELDWVQSLAIDSPKNYQLWHHRRCIIEQLQLQSLLTTKLIESELLSINQILSLDSKNYHSWSHRQWLLSHCTGLYSNINNKELLYINTLLKQDCRNNSAWNHRYFIYTVGNTIAYSVELLTVEFELLMNSYLNHPIDNEAVWNYCNGLLQQQSTINSNHINTLIQYIQSIISQQQQQQQDQQQPLTIRFALSTLIQCYTHSKYSTNNSNIDSTNNNNPYQLAANIASQLANSIDPIRKNYWLFRQAELEKSINNNNTNTAAQ